MTKPVFFDTLFVILPPRAVTAAAASSRVKPSRPPVSTKVRPVSVCASVGPSAGAGPVRFTPAARSFSISARLVGMVNHFRMLSTITGPMPSTASSSSSVASAIRSRWPSVLASARAAVGPTWRMPSADEHPRQRLLLRCLDPVQTGCGPRSRPSARARSAGPGSPRTDRPRPGSARPRRAGAPAPRPAPRCPSPRDSRSR